MSPADDPTWPGRLIQLRADHDWSRRDLVAAIRQAAERAGDRQIPDPENLLRTVRRWESGQSRPDERYRRLLASLGAREEDDRFTLAVTKPNRVDTDVVGRLSVALGQYRHVEDGIGAAALVVPTLALLDLGEHLGSAVEPAVRTQLGELAAQAAQFAAWLHLDVGQDASAERWFERALAWAIETDDRAMVASVFSMRAQGAWSRRDPVRALALSRAASREATRTTPGVAALAAHQEARALALSRDETAALRTQDTVERLADRAADHPEDEPPWVYF